MNLEIPDSFDPEWLSENVKALSERMDRISEQWYPAIYDDDFEECRKIIKAISEFAGE